MRYYVVLKVVRRVYRTSVCPRRILTCYQTRSKRPAQVPPQDVTHHRDLLPNAQYTDRPSKQIHVTTGNPDGMQHALTRKRVKHSLPLGGIGMLRWSIFSALPYDTRIRRYRSYQTVFATTARGHRLPYSLRIACKGFYITV